MNFIKQIIAVIIGFFIALTIFLAISFIGLIILIGIATKVQIIQDFDDKSVLKITLSGEIKEKSDDDDPLEMLNFLIGDETETPIGLLDIHDVIRHASENSQIKGILLHLNTVNLQSASLEEIRKALEDFQKKDKFVIAYGEFMSESAYYIASVADEIYLHPEGFLEFNGYSVESVFLKGTFEKLGIKPEIFRVGAYKSAVEPFLLDKMSKNNREQTLSYVNSLYLTYLQNISKSRQKNLQTLWKVADEMLVRSADEAVSYGLVTEKLYYDQVLKRIQDLLQISENQDIRFISAENYYRKIIASETEIKRSFSSKIAVLVAEGEIVYAGNQPNQISSINFVRQLQKLRKDSTVKAIVLRINSPGGSALASDNLWREIHLTSEVKPVIASLSDVAASGGYYMAMACDSIVALPNTITGSIGIFAILFNTQDFFKEKLGITFDNVKTGKFADIAEGFRPLTETERNIIQQQVEKSYETFTQKAAKDRNLPLEKLLAVAEGRIWTGNQALKNGLVDIEGGILTAIKIAAEKANVADYQVVYYTAERDLWDKLKESGLSYMKNTKLFSYFCKIEEEILSLIQDPDIKARMPYLTVKL
ncbi:MAG: signal peptide peptidase SppA [Cytophagales bacterium]|nr:signal peptide peptidase SppA [Cytophagales bacterium]MDW8383194.1 signal peptide peptidase SppA [Flammeovirgaceae bacterium]